jgi:hypothetical protein
MVGTLRFAHPTRGLRSQFRHCEERSDEAIHLFLVAVDCFANARNDGVYDAAAAARFGRSTPVILNP